MKDKPQIIPNDDVIPEDKRGDKTLRQITEEIQNLLKPYKNNLRMGIDEFNGIPQIIRLNYEIFL